MLAVATLLILVTLSLVVTRVATVALRATGLSKDVSAFQARSAFSGVGFTTSESESVVGHPVRRRIILWLVLLGNAGIVTTVASLMLSFTGATGGQATRRLALLVAGAVGLRVLAGSRIVDHWMTAATEWALRRWTRLDLRDYASLLNVAGPYSVLELVAEPGAWVTGRTLEDLRLRNEGVIVLGIHRKRGGYVGVPIGPTLIQPGDRLVVYGDDETVAELSVRRAGPEGDAAHRAGEERQAVLISEEVKRGSA